MQPKSPDQWDSVLQPIIDDMHGKPLNVHGLLANHPNLISAWWEFRNYAVNGGELQQADCELLILRVAHNIGCWYEWASHIDRGTQAGLSSQHFEWARGDTATIQAPPQICALLNAVDQLMLGRGLAKDAQAQLQPYYTSKQVMDVIAIHSLYLMLGNMIHTWGLDLDTHVERRLPAEQTKASFDARRRNA